MKGKSWIRLISANVLILALLLESVSFLYVKIVKPKVGYLERLPTYLGFSWENEYASKDGDLNYDPLGPHAIDSAYAWCTWHPRNSSHRHKKACFDVMMKFNSEGTRGRLPDPRDSSTVFFLGDSFTEGYGLSEDSTFAALYAEKSGFPTLNLGSVGYLGTTQYSLIYKYFSERYAHKKVVVSLFLANDFLENDIRRYGFFETDKRYRPYRGDTSDLSKLTYKGDYATSKYSWKAYRESLQDTIPEITQYGLREFLLHNDIPLLSKLYHLTYLKRVMYVFGKSPLGKRNPDDPFEMSHDDIDFRILAYDLNSIMETANAHGAQVLFLNIPSTGLVKRAKVDAAMDLKYRELEARISRVVSKSPHRFVSYYQDLIESGENIDQLIFDCDGHYNSRGSYRLARFILASQR